jgi:hypothetical protein
VAYLEKGLIAVLGIMQFPISYQAKKNIREE